jgi:hypothetical protein
MTPLVTAVYQILLTLAILPVRPAASVSAPGYCQAGGLLPGGFRTVVRPRASRAGQCVAACERSARASSLARTPRNVTITMTR